VSGKYGAKFNRALLIAARYIERASERASGEFPGNINDRRATDSRGVIIPDPALSRLYLFQRNMETEVRLERDESGSRHARAALSGVMIGARMHREIVFIIKHHSVAR